MTDLAASFRRVRERDFTKKFYDRFFEADARVPVFFASTDFDRQRSLFEHGVLMIIDHARGGATGRLSLVRLARTHGESGYAIPDQLFRVWERVFLQLAAELDPEWNQELADLWRACLDTAMREIRPAPLRRPPSRAGLRR